MQSLTEGVTGAVAAAAGCFSLLFFFFGLVAVIVAKASSKTSLSESDDDDDSLEEEVGVGGASTAGIAAFTVTVAAVEAFFPFFSFATGIGSPLPVCAIFLFSL